MVVQADVATETSWYNRSDSIQVDSQQVPGPLNYIGPPTWMSLAAN